MLTDAAIRRIKPRAKAFKVADALGLYLLIQPSGSKLWRMNYRFAGRQRTLALGVYDDVSLAEARDQRDAARRLLRQNTDPSAVAKAEKQAETAAADSAFDLVADEWFELKVIGERRARTTIVNTRLLLKTLKAEFGKRPIGEIEPPELLTVLRRDEAEGHYQKVSRLRSLASSIFRFGIATGRCQRDVAADLKGATTAAKNTPHAAVTDPTELGALLRAIDGFPQPMMRLALRLLALTFVRPRELLTAEWREIEGAIWDIPPEKTKMRRPHRVPLSKQAIETLDELRKITGGKRYLLASPRRHGHPIAPNQYNYALRDLGYTNGEHVAHGFRSSASTILNESGLWDVDWIEFQLAHVERSKVRGVYNRAKYWPGRVRMMQWLADHYDDLRSRGEVVALPVAARS
jgi:integrase